MSDRENANLKGSFINYISTQILSGALKPGDRLPPERTLAQQVGISRGSVNQGVLDMERMGFLRIVPRKGTYVADYLDNATPETLSAIMSYDSALISPNLFRNLMDMRILIERECVRLVCARINKAACEQLSKCTNDVYSAGDGELVDALYIFHKSIVQLSGNAAYLMIFQSFEKVLRNLISAHYSNREELKKCLPLYNQLASAISRGDAKEADATMSRILGYGAEYLNCMLTVREGNEL